MLVGCTCTTAKKLWPWVPKHHLPCTALPPGRMSSAKSIRAELKVEQKQEKKKKCSTAESKIVPRGAESRTKTEKKEKMFYRHGQNWSARRRK